MIRDLLKKKGKVYVWIVVCLSRWFRKKFILIKSCLQPIWLEKGEDFGRLSNWILIKNWFIFLKNK
jgi:hypothetical protein